MKMDKRSWLNLVIFVVLIQLGFLIYLSKKVEQATTPDLISLSAELGQVGFQRAGQEPLLLQRQGEQWWLQQPFRAPIDPVRMQALLNISTAKVHSQYELAELNLAEFGLEPPQGVGVLKLGEVELRFGNKSPNGKRYVSVLDKLYLLDDQHLPLLAANGRELVQRRPFDPNLELTLIETPYIRIEKQAGLWRLSESGEAALAAEQLAESWRFSMAEAVLPLQTEPMGAWLTLATEKRQWRYQVINEAPLTLLPEGGRYLLRFSAALSHELLFLPQRAETPPFLDQ